MSMLSVYMGLGVGAFLLGLVLLWIDSWRAYRASVQQVGL